MASSKAPFLISGNSRLIMVKNSLISLALTHHLGSWNWILESLSTYLMSCEMLILLSSAKVSLTNLLNSSWFTSVLIPYILKVELMQQLSMNSTSISDKELSSLKSKRSNKTKIGLDCVVENRLGNWWEKRHVWPTGVKAIRIRLIISLSNPLTSNFIFEFAFWEQNKSWKELQGID